MAEMLIQLLTFEGCPLAAAARIELEAALADYGAADYEEVDILDPMTPEALRGWGSPTILLNGADLMGSPKGAGAHCRVYPGDKGVPVKAEILAAIERRSAPTDIR